MVFAELNCGVQQYDWGKPGSTSAVAQFAAAQDPSFTVKTEEPYAELWMGTHPKVPATFVDPKAGNGAASLREYLEQHPSEIGDAVLAKFEDKQLPYLFKVLSIAKALSIQAHPDKALARQLHARDPKNYPDDNHKPEMALALTDFEGFCGFRPLKEICSFLENVPEFAQLAGEAGSTFSSAIASSPDGDHREQLRALFQSVMIKSDDEISAAANSLAERAREAVKSGNTAGFAGPFGGDEFAKLVVRLDEQFPNDVGLFSGALMLNYCQLKVGDAMFLRAKDPHAYISGDIIECMAASDNVVRAGFTPKFKDVPTLVSMLTCDSGSVADQKMKPEPFAQSTGGKAQLFDPPIDEFAVLRQESPANAKVEISKLTSGSIFIFTEGEGTVSADGKTIPFVTGSTFFIGAGTALEINAKVNAVSYHAICEVA